MNPRIKFKSRADYIFYKADRDKIWEDQGGLCFYCKKPITRSQATLDHVRPIHENRYHSVDNVVVACRACNRRKGTGFVCEGAWAKPAAPVYANYPKPVQEALIDFNNRIDERINLMTYNVLAVATHKENTLGSYNRWKKYWKKRHRL